MIPVVRRGDALFAAVTLAAVGLLYAGARMIEAGWWATVKRTEIRFDTYVTGNEEDNR